MNRKNRMETAGILSLSLLLTSAYSISACLPDMLNSFNDYARSDIELLISIPAMAMAFMIALSPFIVGKMNKRVLISCGLTVIGVAGCVPAFFPSYPLIFVSRILLGIGIGLINTRAVSLIGERFSGNQKARLMGIRGSMETLGQAGLTFLAGQLLVFGWKYSFLVYSVAFVVLLFYLIFVPIEERKILPEDYSSNAGQEYRLKRCDYVRIFCYAILGGLMVSANCVISLRIPSLIIEADMGTGADGATILSLSVLAGFLGGFALGKLTEKWKQLTFSVSAVISAVGMLMIFFANGALFTTFGAVISGFFIAICISCCFNNVSDNIPKEALNTANAAVLIGCNLGSSATPFFLRMIDAWKNAITAGFLIYAIVLLSAGLGFFVCIVKKKG